MTPSSRRWLELSQVAISDLGPYVPAACAPMLAESVAATHPAARALLCPRPARLSCSFFFPPEWPEIGRLASRFSRQ